MQKQEKVEEEEEPEEDEDLSHLTPQERKKKLMKKKLERKRRKKKALQTIVVTTAFRASKDQEISLNVGEQVEILQKVKPEETLMWLKIMRICMFISILTFYLM